MPPTKRPISTTRSIYGFTIEPNVPIVSKPTRGIGESYARELARNMQIGDSILHSNRRVVAYLQATMRKLNMRSAYRTVEGGFRLWRIG